MSAAWTWAALETLHRDAPPLADLLPWRWVEDETVHVMADGSVGLAWALPLQAIPRELAARIPEEPVPDFVTRTPIGDGKGCARVSFGQRDRAVLARYFD